jgi:BMFP domain-containing protein YqiC
MQPHALFQDLQQRLSDLLKSSPVADLERNIKALLGQTFQRLDLVTREEFDTQLALIEQLRERIEALEARIGSTPTNPS